MLSAGPLGPAAIVNQFRANEQFDAQIAATDDGARTVIVWTSQLQDGSGDGVYARVYGAGGVALGNEFLVTQQTAGAQRTAAVAMDADGDFAIVWQVAGTGIWERRFDPSGTAKGAEVLAIADGVAVDPAIAMDAAGNFVVTAASAKDGTSDVFLQRFAADGTRLGATVKANVSIPGEQVQPTVAMAPAGNFTVAWAAGTAIVARRFDAAGAALTGDTALSAVTPLTLQFPSITMDSSGRAVVAWTAGNTATSKWDVIARRFDAAGIALGDEALVNSITSGGALSRPAVVANDAGAFLVTWPEGSSTFGQLYDAAGPSRDWRSRLTWIRPAIRIRLRRRSTPMARC